VFDLFTVQSAHGGSNAKQGDPPQRQLIAALLHSSAVITQTLSVYYISRLDYPTLATLGFRYSTLLVTVNMVAKSNFMFAPEGLFVIGPGDHILLRCSATGAPAVTVYGTILMGE
jgi:hypothetical protein